MEWNERVEGEGGDGKAGGGGGARIGAFGVDGCRDT